MSLKTTKSERKKPRAMPVETIVTRFKSAQQKRQLEKDQTRMTTKVKNKNSSKKSQPKLKKTEINPPRQKKVQKSEKFINIKKIEETQVINSEYYPNKLKRKVLNARKFLAPKHNCKIICGTKSLNKRKLRIPQRDEKYIKERIKYPPLIDDDKALNQKIQSTDLSITDMVRIIEENGTLDDEDLLEILTCPSPVWWEEPLDGYVEDALFSQNRQAECVSVKSKIQVEEEKENERKRHQEENYQSVNSENDLNIRKSLDISIESRDKNFMNKRCKLEALLGIIKNKGVKPIINQMKSNKNRSDTADERKKEEKSRYCAHTADKIEDECVKLKPKEVEGKKEVKKGKRYSECTEEEFNEFRDDEILTHLENLEIPVEGTLNNKSKDVDDVSTSRRGSIESDSSDKNMSEEYLDLSFLDDDDDDVKQDIGDETNTERNESNNTSDETNELKLESEIYDGLNETFRRIKSRQCHLNDKNENIVTNKTACKTDKNENYEEKTEEIDENEDTEFVTVYKIINNEAIIGIDESDQQIVIDKIKDTKDTIDNKGKINSYYKQCKKVSKVLKSMNESNNRSDVKLKDKSNRKNKTITISDTDNVKYCFICSSIFDSVKCNYCLRRTLKRKLHEYSCDVCGLNVDTRQEMIQHLRKHSG